jgi:HD-GYP domain-containing protein (c-di-GMP phosphodiesterase class II)
MNRPGESALRRLISPGRPLVARPGVTGLFSAAMRFPITLVSAPAGFGKTVALNETLTSYRGCIARYDVDPSIDSFFAFVRGLAQAVSAIRPSALLSFPGAYERALESSAYELKLANWLGEHLKGVNATIAVDELHHVEHVERIGAFLSHLAELTGEKVRWVFVARSDCGLPVPRWLAERRMDVPIDASALRFTIDDALRAAVRLGLDVAPARIRKVVRETDGWPTGVMFGLISTPISSYAMLAEGIYGERSEHQRQFLRETCLLTRIDNAICSIIGWPNAGEIIDELGHDAQFIFAHSGEGIRYQDCFAQFLVDELRASDALETTVRRTVAALETIGAPREAMRLASKYELRDEIVRQLDRYGLQMLERGDADVVKTSLDLVDLAEADCTGTALAIKATFESRSGRIDTSEAWFQMALARVGDARARAEIAYLYGRDLLQRRRPDSIEMLAPYAADESLPYDLRVSILSSLAQGYIQNGEPQEADACVRTALEIGRELTDRSALARLYVRAAYVALYSGDCARARAMALRGARLSEACGEFHVACGAYSILYAVAADNDNPRLCLRYAERIKQNGAKCADPRWQLYALIAAYELETERANVETVAALRRDLQAFDVHYATLDALEGLLPSQALEHAWNGRFAEAHRLLTPSASEQIEPDRSALRWAEVALYAAAAGLKKDAAAALRSSRSSLKSAASSVRTRRAAVYDALALRLIGRRSIAARLLESLESDPQRSQRLIALSAAVVTVCRRLDGAENSDELALAARQLAERDCAGLARMLLALPDLSTKKSIPRRSDASTLLDADRLEYIALLLDASVPPEDRTLGLTLAAHRLTKRLLEFLDDDRPDEFATWLDSFLEEYAETEAARTLVSQVPETVALMLQRRNAGNDPCRKALGALDQLIRVATLRPRRRATVADVEILDEIDAAINRLISRLDAANPLTAEHSRAVASWCKRLGRRIGLSEQDVIFASRCGLVHDVGKVTTPLSILDAPRALDDEEWKIMRDHAAAGESIVRSVPMLVHLTPAVRSHHERLDGKGYPDAIRGSSIPFIARLVAVADCFNALIGRRPYRKPMSPLVALDHLEHNTGNHFDPELVHAMVDVVTGK